MSKRTRRTALVGLIAAVVCVGVAVVAFTSRDAPLDLQVRWQGRSTLMEARLFERRRDTCVTTVVRPKAPDSAPEPWRLSDRTTTCWPTTRQPATTPIGLSDAGAPGYRVVVTARSGKSCPASRPRTSLAFTCRDGASIALEASSGT